MGSHRSGESDNPEPRKPAPMPPTGDMGRGYKPSGKAGGKASGKASGKLDITNPYADVEPGWKAARSLMRLRSDELLAVMLRPSFRPVSELELVQVVPCPYCGDGGLRMAGSVRVRQGRVAVRACDTCATVDIGERPAPRGRRS